MAFDESAQFYDAIYTRLKDYRLEADKIAAQVRSLDANYRTILDVACGTGEHARYLSQAGFAVDGLDLNPEFVRIAQQKTPTGRFFQADMSDFELPHRYDVVACLFSSIGYLCTLERVALALKCFRRHLLPGGALIVEPWLEPGILDPKRVTRTVTETPDIHITRTDRFEIQGRISRLRLEYEITDAAGTRKAEEIHDLGLFTQPQMTDVFRATGFAVTYDPVGLSNRGLYVARVTS